MDRGYASDQMQSRCTDNEQERQVQHEHERFDGMTRNDRTSPVRSVQVYGLHCETRFEKNIVSQRRMLRERGAL